MSFQYSIISRIEESEVDSLLLVAVLGSAGLALALVAVAGRALAGRAAAGIHFEVVKG